MTQIVEEDESTSELELDNSSELQNNPFEEEKTFDDFNNKINEFDSLIDQKEKTWMDTIIDNKDLIFTAINVFGFCYGMYKFKAEKSQITKQLYENTERLKELDLNLFRVETYTKHLLKQQQQQRWIRKGKEIKRLLDGPLRC
jgi:hypothetical protein